jgi:hypothetical protein
MDEQTGERVMIQRYGKRYYFYLSDTDIMFSAPGEGDIKNAETYSMINAICRLASKARETGLDWSTIARQLRNANVTSARTWTADIANIIEDHRLCP